MRVLLRFAHWILLFSQDKLKDMYSGNGPLFVELEDLDGVFEGVLLGNLLKRADEGRFLDLARPWDIARYVYRCHRDRFPDFLKR